MIRYWLGAALVGSFALSVPAQACRIFSPADMSYVNNADVVVIGRVTNYRVMRDAAFRQRMLANPDLSASDRRFYEGSTSLLPDYARFDIEVDETLVGSVPRRIAVHWDNSTFAEPDRLPAGPLLIALRRPSPHSRAPNPSDFGVPEPGAFMPLQQTCSTAFIYETSTEQAQSIRRILSAPPQ